MTIEELIGDQLEQPDAFSLQNLHWLLVMVNRFEELVREKLPGGKLVCNSGWRSWAKHKAIYQAINDKRLIAGKPELPIPLHSAHLSGNAVDLNDPDGTLKVLVAENIAFFEKEGGYFEAFIYTNGWVHLQRVAPRSGVRFFVP